MNDTFAKNTKPDQQDDRDLTCLLVDADAFVREQVQTRQEITLPANSIDTGAGRDNGSTESETVGVEFSHSSGLNQQWPSGQWPNEPHRSDQTDAARCPDERHGDDTDDPHRFGKFRLLELIDHRENVRVYHAMHIRLRKPVALSILSPACVHDDIARQRFGRQVRLLSGLAHPNLIRLETAGEHRGIPYLVMECLSGISLQVLMERVGKLPVADACQLIGQAALGLTHLQDSGWRPFKLSPASLRVTVEGTVKIAEFGIGKGPEKADDLHSLGCTFYALLAGTPLDSDGDRLDQHSTLPDMDDFGPDLSDEVKNVLRRMTDLHSADRYKTPMRVVTALAPLAAGCDIPSLLARADVAPPPVEAGRTPTIDTANYLTLQAQQFTESGALRAFLFQQRRPQWFSAAMLLGFGVVMGIALWRPWATDSDASKSRFADITVAESSATWLKQNASEQVDIHGSSLADDLLGSIDLSRDAFQLDARQETNSITLGNPATRGILQLPVVTPDAYTLEFMLERLDGEGSFGIGCSAAGGRLLALLDDQHHHRYRSGLMFVAQSNDRQVLGPEGEQRLLLEQPRRVRLIVNRQAAELLLRDAAQWKTLARWDLADHPAPPKLGPFDGYYPGVLYLHVFSGTFKVSDLRMLDYGSPPTLQPFFGPDGTAERRVAEQIVWRGGHVEVVTDSGVKTVHRLEELTREPWLQSVTKCGASPRLAFGDEVVQELSAAADLKVLDLRTSDMTAGLLPSLNGLSRLEKLSLPPTAVAPAALAGLDDLPGLRELSLIDSSLEDGQIGALYVFPSLTSLCLSGTKVTDQGLEQVATMFPGLKHLCVNGCSVNGSSFDRLASLQQLQDLELADTDVDNEDIAVLSQFSSLQSLNLRSTDVTPAGIERLSERRPEIRVNP